MPSNGSSCLSEVCRSAAPDRRSTGADGAAEDPQQASEALDRIDKNVDDIQKDTGDADVKKAVDHLDGIQAKSSTTVAF
ncbi:hypothetical protein ADL35_42035, partial [Streptomyces sp. NRRL WC-3753]